MAKLSTTQQKTARKIAYHEAGHYIIGRTVGFKVSSISLKMGSIEGGTATIVTTRPITDVASVKKYLEDRVIALYAGAMGETLQGGFIDNNDTNKLIESSAAVDHAKIREMLFLLRNIRNPNLTVLDDTDAQLTAIDSELRLKTMALLEGKKVAHAAIAEAIIVKVQMTDRDYVLTLDEINALPAVKSAFP